MRPFTETQFSEGGRASLAPLFPDDPDYVVLAADTLYRHPIRTGAKYVSFSFEGDGVYVRLGVSNTALVLPSAPTTDGSGGEHVPSQRRIPAFLADGTTVPTHICFRCAAAVKGSIVFWS